MPIIDDHIASLGFRLEFAERAAVEPLLSAVRLPPLDEPTGEGWTGSKFLCAMTAAGGTAACIGWNRRGKNVVVHSLAVATPSRGTGVGGGLIASALGHIMDDRPVKSAWLATVSTRARRLFSSMGFTTADADEVPDELREHMAFQIAPDHAKFMVRAYPGKSNNLDNCAFRLIVNETEGATLPLGSVFFFRQFGAAIEATYRGGPVTRGQLLGVIDGEALPFLWQHVTRDLALQHGDGKILLEPLPDGRRELREQLSANSSDPGELLLREV